jgi:hypothetical protein
VKAADVFSFPLKEQEVFFRRIVLYLEIVFRIRETWKLFQNFFFVRCVFERWFIGCIVFVCGDNLMRKTHRISSTVVVRIL